MAVTATDAEGARHRTRSPISRRISRYALAGPITLVSVQVLADFLFLQLPATLAAKANNQRLPVHLYLNSFGAYSDLYSLYWTHHLFTHPWPYIDARIEYPVVLGMYMTAAAALTHGIRAYFALSSLGLYASAVGSVCCLWSVSKKAAWIFSICPLLLVFSLLNWDLLAIFLMLLGWRAWTRERYSQAAIWLTLGTFAKLYPIFLLVFFAVELVRRARSQQLASRVATRFILVSVAVAAVVNLPFVILAPHNWAYFWVFNEQRNQPVSIAYWLRIVSRTSSLATVNLVFEGVLGLAVLAGAYSVWRGTSPTRVAAVVFAVFLLMQKVYSPQYMLWLIPYALIAEWEFWSICVITMVGFANYSAAATNIYLRIPDKAAANWFGANMGPLERDVRLSSIIVVTMAALLKPAVRRALAKLTTSPTEEPDAGPPVSATADSG